MCRARKNWNQTVLIKWENQQKLHRGGRSAYGRDCERPFCGGMSLRERGVPELSWWLSGGTSAEERRCYGERIGQDQVFVTMKQEGWERWNETESDLQFRKIAWMSGWKVTRIFPAGGRETKQDVGTEAQGQQWEAWNPGKKVVMTGAMHNFKGYSVTVTYCRGLKGLYMNPGQRGQAMR